MSEVQGSLREALYETLNGILATDQGARQAAEQRLHALEVTEEFGIHLTEFVVDPNGPLVIRQLASVLLKQYVENHWNSLAEKFRPPELKPHVKEKIKELLPMGLRESISKVRIAVAYAISRIAHWEWPENWPGLFDILVNCLSGENEYAVHGAMRVLTEFTRDLSDTHLPNVGPVILQEMFRIIQSDTQYSIRTRGRAVEIFTTIASLVAETGVYNKGFIEQHLQPVIPMFCEKFVQCLGVPNGPTSDSGLKTEIIKSINCLILKLSKYMVTFVPQILPSIWTILTESAKVYQEEAVNGTGEVNDGDVDSDGDVINFNNLIIATFEFISTLIDHKKYSNLLNNFLPDIMYYIIIFMQVTEDQIDLWTNNPNQFIEEDDQCATAYNVRISGQELLQTLLSYSEEASANSLCSAITKHIEAANNPQSPNCVTRDPENVWKICESCIFALNSSKDSIVDLLQSGKLQFDMIRFLDSVVLTTLNNSAAHPLLLGRCLCIGGRYAKILPPELSSRFLEASINGLQENQSICIRISSIKAIYWFCQAAHEENNAALVDVLRPHLPSIFEGLFGLASQPSKEIITLVLDAFSVLVPLDQAFTATVENKICPLAIAVFLKFHSDPELLNLCQEIFKDLSLNPSCVEPLQTRLVPTLISMMNVAPSDKPKDEGTRSVALDIMQVLVSNSPHPLSSALIAAFSASCQCILDSTDNSTLQNGGEVLRAYLTVAPEQIISHRDNEGRTGLDFILLIIAQLLNPQSSEFTATFVGRLVTTLIRKAGSTLGSNLDLLLKAVLSKMQRTETSTVMQSLLMIYAHLINSEFDAVLNFLSTVPGPSGESALVFVLTEWVSKQQLFFGSYDRKVSTVALCKLLEYGVTQDDMRLNEIMVDGDLVYLDDDSTGVRTRSKGQSAQWTKVPVLVKIFKLIVYEFGHYLEVNSAEQNEEESDDDDEGDDSGIIDPGNDVTPLCLDDLEDELDEEEDPDIKQDSIYQLNLGHYLRDFLQNFSSHHGFPLFAQHLNANERKCIENINSF